MSSDLTLVISIFCRIFGFFILSPLFSNIPVPRIAKFGFALALSLLFAPFFISSEPNLPKELGFQLLYFIKEVLLGYLLGFIFSFILEAAALAGQVVGTLSGFSATELLDPMSSATQPLGSRLFVLFVTALIFALDLHHQFLKILYKSFAFFPFSGSFISQGTIETVLESSIKIFQYAFEFAAFPLAALLAILLLFSLTSKMLPNFPIFWTGFPIQILAGLCSIIIGVSYFSTIVQQAFFDVKELLARFFFELSAFL